jgi:hypothetical protein
MKESKLIEMQNKVETLGKVTQKLMMEVQQLTQLSVGTLETIKNMEGYDQAIEKLKKEMVTKSGKAKKADTSGKIIE